MATPGSKPIYFVVALALLAVIGAIGYWVARSVPIWRHYALACEALERYEYADARTHLRRCLADRPTDPMLLLLSAQAARRLGDLEEAKRLLASAKDNGAAAPDVDLELQLLKIHAGDLADVNRLAQSLGKKPDDPESAILLEAMIEGTWRARDLGRHEKFVDFWLEHRTSKIDQAQGLVWNGRHHLMAGDNPARAVAEFRRAVEMAPEHSLARIWLVEVLLLQNTDDAVPHLEWLRMHRPDDPWVKFQLARWHRTYVRFDEAGRLLDDLLSSKIEDSAILFDGGRVAIMVERGMLAIDQNRLQDAERWLLQALSMAPQHRGVNLILGNYYLRSGRPKEAKRYQDMVQTLDAKSNQRDAPVKGNGPP